MAPLFVYVVHTPLGVEEQQDGGAPLYSPLLSFAHSEAFIPLLRFHTTPSCRLDFLSFTIATLFVFSLKSVLLPPVRSSNDFAGFSGLMFVYMLHYFC